jgi:hypothetical protein
MYAFLISLWDVPWPQVRLTGHYVLLGMCTPHSAICTPARGTIYLPNALTPIAAYMNVALENDGPVTYFIGKRMIGKGGMIMGHRIRCLLTSAVLVDGILAH